jgi:hypothetical protein
VADCIVDTNVLLVASAQHPGSPFDDSNVPEVHMQVVLDWLMAFRKDSRVPPQSELDFSPFGVSY